MCILLYIYIYGNSNITNSFCQLHILGCTNDVYTSDRTKINWLFFCRRTMSSKTRKPRKIAIAKNRGNFHDVTSQFMLGLIATLLAATNRPFLSYPLDRYLKISPWLVQSNQVLLLAYICIYIYI